MEVEFASENGGCRDGISATCPLEDDGFHKLCSVYGLSCGYFTDERVSVLVYLWSTR